MKIKGEHNTADVKIEEEIIEEECREQIQEMVNHEAFEGSNNVKVMPDTHWGAGAVIGFTMPLKNRVCPNTIGVDIGCGMFAVNFGDIDIEDNLEELDEKIREKVPMGFNVHDRADYHMKDDFPWDLCQEKLEKFNENSEMPDVEADYSHEYFKELVKKLGYDMGRAINSMGTLGGGNHFIEIGRSQEDREVWCIIHSGSRGIGAKIAEYWQDRATELRTMSDIRKYDEAAVVEDNGEGTKEVDLFDYVKFSREDSDGEILDWLNGAKGESFKKKDKIREDLEGKEIQAVHNLLTEMVPQKKEDERNTDLDYLEGEEAAGYIRDMIFAQTYASQSRVEMMAKVREAIEEVTEVTEKWADIESVHNYIDFEDQTIRKGACRAHEDELIVIPFNMSFGTLIAKGKGEENWNNSAPHGAGRAMSRTKAKEKYSEEDMKDQVGDVYMSKTPVDETPKAYKDPEIVEEAIGETAEIVDRIKPVISLKAE